MFRLLLIALLALSAGCASKPPAYDSKAPNLYAEVELKYALPFSTDYWQHSDRSWQCEQPQIEVEVGMEWANGLSLGVYHESMVLCGTWNSKPEIFENGIVVGWRWGGA